MSDTTRLPATAGHRSRPPAGLRALEVVSGLLSAGVLVLGLVLLVSQLGARHLLSGTGLAAATGPGWWRVAVHLVVGAAGEVGMLLRRSAAPAVRAVVASVTVVAVVVVLGAAWWF